MSNRHVRTAKKEAADARSVELTRIYNEAKAAGERLTPSLVVESAKPRSSPLHDEFEWDDKKAGYEYRLAQARTLIRVIPIITEAGSERAIHVPTESQKQSKEGFYEPLSVVVQDVDLFGRALGELESKLRAAVQACDELRLAAEASGNADQMRMAQITVAMTAIKTASDVVRALH